VVDTRARKEKAGAWTDHTAYHPDPTHTTYLPFCFSSSIQHTHTEAHARTQQVLVIAVGMVGEDDTYV